MKTRILLRWILIVSVLLGINKVILPQEVSDAERAKKAQNPIANMISLPFQNNTDFGLEPGYQFKNILNIQPVVPVADFWAINLYDTQTRSQLQTVPGKSFFVCLKMYGPTEPWIEGKWRPGDVELVK